MFKKLLACLCATAMCATAFTGCGTDEVKSSSDVPTDEKQEVTQEPLKWAIKASEAGRQEIQNLVDLAAENGIAVEVVALPDPAPGEADKLLISLMGGESFDLILGPMGNMIPYINANVLAPVDQLATDAGYDMGAVFGDYVGEFNGVTYGVPAFVDTALTLYNKDLFDAAGVPYPTSENWTWEKFIEVGAKITNDAESVYGGFNPLWAHYNYMYAMQKGATHFKEDGTSNYDDPLFKESVEFYYGLGTVEKVNPDFLIQKSKQMPIDYFTTGNVGMSVAGGWTSVWLTDTEKYPREWKAGILPMPYPEGQDKSSSVVVSNFYIPNTSTRKELAFECATLFAENHYLMGGGRVPARVDLGEEEINRYIETDLLKAFAFDGITVEEIKAVWFDTTTIPFEEKMISSASGDINKAFVDECGLYGIGEQDIDTTMKNIKERADKAIIDSKK